jgi:hypothetical protein
MPPSPIPGGNTRAYGTVTNVAIVNPVEILRSTALQCKISGAASIAPNTPSISPGMGLIRDGGTGQYRPVLPATEAAELVAANYVYLSATEQQVCDVYLTGVFKYSELLKYYTAGQIATVFVGCKIHINLDAVIIYG